MWILAAEFEYTEAARSALDDIEREIGLAGGGEIGRLAPTDGDGSRHMIAGARIPREHAETAREIFRRAGGRIVADLDAARAESPSV